MAIAAMPTAVLMGMSFTPTLAQADDRPAVPRSTLTAEEYQACVEVLEEAEKGGAAEEDEDKDKDTDEGTGGEDKPAPDDDGGADGDKPPASEEPEEPEPTEPGAEEPAPAEPGAEEPEAPAEEEPEKPNLLEGIGDALKDLFDGPDAPEEEPASEEPAAGAEDEPAADEPEAGTGTKDGAEDGAEDGEKTEPAAKAPKEAVEKTAEAVEKAEEAAEKGEPVEETTAPAVDPEDCPAATDEEGGLEGIVALPDHPWELQASSLLLKGARYEGIVKVKTANGTVKEVLKYVVSDGTDIGDLHQVVHDKENGRTHHAVAAKGSTSTIRGGDTVMYTESISGNLLGLLPVTFSPEHPPPLDIPIIYFTKVKVVQAGQFGGDLTIPGLRQYID
ncbi:hypothetical protein [Streptomyces sp. NPDC047130]|uniref:hypothetical protein n=1 Tax=Streptomyces sp. NPDC047130 TaxID=3155261 RepID=UPI0033E7B36B